MFSAYLAGTVIARIITAIAPITIAIDSAIVTYFPASPSPMTTAISARIPPIAPIKIASIRTVLLIAVRSAPSFAEIPIKSKNIESIPMHPRRASSPLASILTGMRPSTTTAPTRAATSIARFLNVFPVSFMTLLNLFKAMQIATKDPITPPSPISMLSHRFGLMNCSITRAADIAISAIPTSRIPLADSDASMPNLFIALNIRPSITIAPAITAAPLRSFTGFALPISHARIASIPIAPATPRSERPAGIAAAPIGIMATSMIQRSPAAPMTAHTPFPISSHVAFLRSHTSPIIIPMARAMARAEDAMVSPLPILSTLPNAAISPTMRPPRTAAVTVPATICSGLS